MRKKKKMSAVLAVTLLIIGVLLIFNGGKKGSAAYDPDAVRADGLYISLDKDKWDLENVESWVPENHSDLADELRMTVVHSFSDVQRNSVRLEIGHYKLNTLTYEEYCDLVYSAESSQQYEILLDEKICVENYITRRRIIKIHDNKVHDGMIIGKGHYIYTVNYSSQEELYENYTDAIQASIDSIHIKNFR